MLHSNAIGLKHEHHSRWLLQDYIGLLKTLPSIGERNHINFVIGNGGSIVSAEATTYITAVQDQAVINGLVA